MTLRHKLIATISIFVLFLASVVSGWLVLIHPDNFIVRMARAPITASSEYKKLIVGPFPLDSDFIHLRESGVTTIVSLLNPAIPYEGNLLEQEKEMAKKYGISLFSFPMSSILGQKFGNEYQSNALIAAEAILRAPGKVYLHCYLGLHRSKAVLDLLKEKNISFEASTYPVRQAERSPEFLLSDEIDVAFAKGNYHRVLELIPANKTHPSNHSMLRNWSLYRLGKFTEAKAGFTSIVQSEPNQVEAMLGAAFSSMQLADLIIAERLFTTALLLEPDNSDAWTGLGMVHFRSGKLTEAKNELRRALELNHDNAEAAEIFKKMN